MPIFGFNTDVKVGGTVFHVQTEDRGVENPVLNTTVYVRGRVLAKRANSYEDFLASPDFNEPELHAMLEEQHKRIIEEVRAGQLTELSPLEALPDSCGISVQLLNPATFLKGTVASLHVAVNQRGTNAPVAAVPVRVSLHTGTPQPFEFEAQTNKEGKAEFGFHMPRLGPGGAELVIQASASGGQDEIKYTVRPRRKAGA
ncbi:MAG: hypothetical protein ACE5IP_00620 [Terriglobia bacterium]